MSIGLPPTVKDLRPFDRQLAEIGPAVQAVLAQLQTPHQRKAGERRRCVRYAFPRPIHLTQLDDEGTPLDSAPLLVIGRQISEQALDFYHETPLHEKTVIASFEQDGAWMSFLLELKWCRFHSNGWCENGGRFLQAVAPPLESLPSIYKFHSLFAAE